MYSPVKQQRRPKKQRASWSRVKIITIAKRPHLLARLFGRWEERIIETETKRVCTVFVFWLGRTYIEYDKTHNRDV